MLSEQHAGAFDGSAKPNPGNMKIGGWIATPTRRIIKEFSEEIGYGTANEAEYRACIRLLEECKKLGITNISVRSDSELVVNQINGVSKTKDPKMKMLKGLVMNLCDGGIKLNISHVPRKYNTMADRLSHQ